MTDYYRQIIRVEMGDMLNPTPGRIIPATPALERIAEDDLEHPHHPWHHVWLMLEAGVL